MSVTDFLFDGKTPTPIDLTNTTRVELPEWYTEYTKGMLSKAKAFSDLPYETYKRPRIAEFTKTEREGAEAARKAARSFEPFTTKAGSTLDEAAKRTGGASAAAAGDFAKASGMSAAGAARPFFERAGDVSSYGAAKGYFSDASRAIKAGGEGSSLGAAQRYIDAASETFPGAVDKYMNPYIKGVVEQIGDIGIRQLKEKYLPEIGQEFIGAGQFGVGPGSTRMGEFGARALRDVQSSILGEQAKALQAGYGQAADIYGKDLARLVELAGLSGKLSTDDYNRMIEGGRSLADIGAKAGALTSEDANRMLEIGKASGTLTAEDAQNLTRIAESKGRLSTEDAAALRELSDKYLTMGRETQDLETRGAKTLTEVGEKERAMDQANLDLAYKDFLEQRDYPKDMLKFLSDILSGVNVPSVKTETRQELPPGATSETDVSKLANAYKVIDEILKSPTGSAVKDFLKKMLEKGN